MDIRDRMDRATVVLLLMELLYLAALPGRDAGAGNTVPETETQGTTTVEMACIPQAGITAWISAELEKAGDAAVTVEPETKEPELEQSTSYTESDQYLLAKIAMAEAEGEDTEGKALVICVVLNRVASCRFPDTVRDVLYQTHQFTPLSDGRWDRVEPDADCYKALEMVEDGWDGSQGATYFERTDTASTWHSRNLEKLYEHGSVSFYKEKD
jgi:spore germination cell wall hydrolase CwlJ-like protein